MWKQPRSSLECVKQTPFIIIRESKQESARGRQRIHQRGARGAAGGRAGAGWAAQHRVLLPVLGTDPANGRPSGSGGSERGEAVTCGALGRCWGWWRDPSWEHGAH